MISLHLDHLRKVKSRVAPNFQGSLMKRTALALSAAFISFPLAAQDQPTRPPITGIAHVRIYSTDLHKSLDFYSQILGDRKSTRLNSSHQIISYAVFCLKKK